MIVYEGNDWNYNTETTIITVLNMCAGSIIVLVVELC